MFEQKRFKFRNSFMKIGLCLLLTACSSGGSGGTAALPCATFDCKGMLNNLGTNIMMPTINDFKTKADAMKTAVDAYVVALAANPTETTKRDAARDAWKLAMATWQAVEVMQIGPLTDTLGVLRDKIYSWPVTNNCGVDQDVVFADTGSLSNGTTDYVLAERTRDRRGMDALEYVLFNEDLNHSCGTSVPVGWSALTDVKAARATYAKLAAADVSAQAQILLDQWNGTTGFLVELTQAGSSASRFTSVEAAVNAVSDALFYYEDETKDIKLAKPLGLKANACSATANNQGCAKEVESPFSLTSKENIKNNLLALQELFLGNKPGAATALLGFDDFLDALGGDSSLLKSRIAAAIPKVDEISPTLKAAVISDKASVQEAWDAAKLVTDQLKENFLEVLKLNIPGSAAGDGD